MRKCRKPISQKSPNDLIEKIFSTFEYDPLTGEIFNKVRNRSYKKKTKKGYRSDIYIFFEQIEYYIKYHRLCWLLYHRTIIPDSVQIDHENNIKDDNKIKNLRLCSNDDNSKKKKLRKGSTSGYKGVSLSLDKNKYGTEYRYFKARIASVKGKNAIVIGRFKTAREAAIYYDSAARFYFKDFSLCNFKKEYIPPMSIEDLKIYKKSNL